MFILATQVHDADELFLSICTQFYRGFTGFKPAQPVSVFRAYPKLGPKIKHSPTKSSSSAPHAVQLWGDGCIVHPGQSIPLNPRFWELLAFPRKPFLLGSSNLATQTTSILFFDQMYGPCSLKHGRKEHLDKKCSARHEWMVLKPSDLSLHGTSSQNPQSSCQLNPSRAGFFRKPPIRDPPLEAPPAASSASPGRSHPAPSAWRSRGEGSDGSRSSSIPVQLSSQNAGG